MSRSEGRGGRQSQLIFYIGIRDTGLVRWRRHRRSLWSLLWFTYLLTFIYLEFHQSYSFGFIHVGSEKHCLHHVDETIFRHLCTLSALYLISCVAEYQNQ